MPEDLVRGFIDFRKNEYEGENPLMPKLVKDGQDPKYFMISCIDSRSNPGTIFRPAPGTFFAHKAMGAIVRPYKHGTALAAALQFAINHNNVTKIIVLGHTGCGAIQALIDGIDDTEIASFVDVAAKGLEKARHICDTKQQGCDLNREAEEQIVLQSIENLKTYPSVVQGLEENKIVIKPWLFDMKNGALLEYNHQSEKFEDILENNIYAKD